MDNYTEQILPSKPTVKDYILYLIAILLTVTGAFFMIFISMIIGVIIIALGSVAIYFSKNIMDYEYEYIFTNGDLDVAKIIAKTSRKNVFTVREDEIIRILPYNSDKFRNELEINDKMVIRDYTSKEQDNSDNWFAFISNNKNNITVILELNDKNQEYIKKIYKNKIEK